MLKSTLDNSMRKSSNEGLSRYDSWRVSSSLASLSSKKSMCLTKGFRGLEPPLDHNQNHLTIFPNSA